MAKKTCAFCGKKGNNDEMYVKHAGKHNTYYCDIKHFELAMERKKKRDEIKRRKAIQKAETKE